MSKPNVETRPEFEQHPLLEKIEILHIHQESGNIAAMVPVELVYQQDVPVDAEHVMDLAKSIQKETDIKGGHGQLSPVSLAEVEGFDQFLIVDGFHRTPAVQSLGRSQVYATIRPNSTMDDVIDHRILAATTHRSVRFSRVVEWVEEAWRRTPWARKLGSISAFSLTFSPTMTGRNLGLSTEEADDIKQWVQAKCDFWHLKPQSIYKNLNIARNADPELVKEARERRGGRELVALTPQHLEVVTKTFPNNYEVQKLLAEVAKTHAMTVPKLRAAALILQEAKNFVEAKELAEKTDWSTVEPILARPAASRQTKPEPQSLTRSTIELLAEAEYGLSKIDNIIKTIGKTSIKNSLKVVGSEQIKEVELTDKLRKVGQKCLDLADSLEIKKLKSSDQNGIEEFENSLVSFIENGGTLPYITNRRIEAARSVIQRFSTYKRLQKDKGMSDRYVELDLVVSSAEQRLEKSSNKK